MGCLVSKNANGSEGSRSYTFESFRPTRIKKEDCTPQALNNHRADQKEYSRARLKSVELLSRNTHKVNQEIPSAPAARSTKPRHNHGSPVNELLPLDSSTLRSTYNRGRETCSHPYSEVPLDLNSSVSHNIFEPICGPGYNERAVDVPSHLQSSFSNLNELKGELLSIRNQFGHMVSPVPSHCVKDPRPTSDGDVEIDERAGTLPRMRKLNISTHPLQDTYRKESSGGRMLRPVESKYRYSTEFHPNHFNKVSQLQERRYDAIPSQRSAFTVLEHFV